MYLSGLIFKTLEAPRRAPGRLGAIGQQSELLIENLTSYGSASFPRVGVSAEPSFRRSRLALRFDAA